MAARDYKGAARQTTLLVGIGSADTSFTVAASGGTGYPTGSGGDFVVALDMGLAGEEKILCSARVGDTFTVATSGRGWDDTTASSHANNATVNHVGTATDLREANQHINGATARHAATAISYAGSTNLSATNVEAALDELDSEKLATSAAAELIRDTIGTALVAGSNVTLTVNDAGDTITIASVAGSAPLVGVGVARNATQSIPNLGATVQWDTEDFDTNTFHDAVTNPDRITIPSGKSGYYQINALVTFSPNSVGSRRVYLTKNGSSTIASSESSGSGAIATTVAASALANLSAGDYLTVTAYQNSGGALNIDPQSIRGITLSLYLAGT